MACREGRGAHAVTADHRYYFDPTEPLPSPAPTISAVPTTLPTPTPTPYPSYTPTPVPSAMPSPAPSASPTSLPTPEPSISPIPTPLPTPQPSYLPTSLPTANPSPLPTLFPSSSPTAAPTPAPTTSPTSVPSPSPTMTFAPSVTSAPTTSPTWWDQPNTTDMALWLRADDVACSTDGDAVSSWADRSSQGNDASQTSSTYRPVCAQSSSELGGQPAVRFGSEDSITMLTCGSPIYSSGAGLTVFLVITNVATPASSEANWIFDYGQWSGRGFGLRPGYMYTPTNWGGKLTTGFGWSHLMQLSIVFGDSQTVSIDGTALEESTITLSALDNETIAWQPVATSVATGGAFTIGAASNYTSQADRFGGFDLAELIVYTTALSSDEIRRVEQYLDKRYELGLPSPMPTATPTTTTRAPTPAPSVAPTPAPSIAPTFIAVPSPPPSIGCQDGSHVYRLRLSDSGANGWQGATYSIYNVTQSAVDAEACTSSPSPLPTLSPSSLPTPATSAQTQHRRRLLDESSVSPVPIPAPTPLDEDDGWYACCF